MFFAKGGMALGRDLLIGDVFRSAASAVPHRVAAALGDTELSFAQIDESSNRTARALARTGVGTGDRVVVWSATAMDTVPVFAAAAKLGAVFAPMNAGLSAEEATAMAGTIKPSAILVDAERSGPGSDVAARLGAVALSITCLAASPEPRGSAATPPDIPNLAQLAASEDGSDFRCEGLGEDDPHVIFFTSGSTGRPKGVVISHRVSYLRTHPGALLEPRGPMVCPYPLFHMGAWTIALQQWQARDRVVLLPSFDAPTLCRAIERHRATRLNGIPAIWRRLLDHLAEPAGRGVDLSSVRVADTGTSATPLELLDAIRAALPEASLRVFYGSTEAGPVAMLEDADISRKPGSCGLVVPTAEVRLEPSGEVLVRGPLLFDGYFDDPRSTEEAFDDGWFRTGDLAATDEDGYLTIVGRAKDVIRTGGETVAPSEVEEALAGHPSVDDVAVVGLPDVRWGEIVCAVIVPAEGASPPGLDELRHYCEPRLARFKHPRRLVVVDTIPRTQSTNQVQRRLLAERLS
jgi:acyl-CoA synthetase (AMP-forming)/AMP-acid ligase II